jgi:hypothetical protein
MTEPGWFYSGRYDHGLRSLRVLRCWKVLQRRRLVDYAHRTVTWVAAVFIYITLNGDATLWLSGVGVSEGRPWRI